MTWLRNIYDQTDKPVGRTTLRRLLLAFVLFLIPLVIFTYIAHEILEGETVQLDNRVLLGIYHHSTPLLNEIVVRTTDLGGVIVTIGAALTLAGLYVSRTQWQSCAQIAAGIAGAGLLNVILKLLFERDRPVLWQHLILENSYSFPSGHAMLSSALAFSLIIIFWHSKWRWYVLAAGIAYTLYIGFTRLYLGVHYPTDIIAGWCVSAAWVIIVATVLGSLTVPKRLTNLFKK
jgi:membrane-associated phospholipid phosphatase